MLEQDAIDRANNADLLTLVPTPLKRVSTSGGGEYAGPCPACGGHDRFHVQPAQHRWLCRRCTDGRWRDAIALYRLVAPGASFVDAVRALAGEVHFVPSHRPAPRPVAVEPETAEPPGPAWQARASDFIAGCQKTLWSRTEPGAQEVRQWLMKRRGLSAATQQLWQIGWNPCARTEPPEWWGLPAGDDPVYLAAGVVIPCLVGRAVWYLKVRRLDPGADPKYVHVRGSRPALYLADTITAATRVVVLVEGEFDGLVMLQSVRARRWPAPVSVATFGAATNRLRPPWTTRLAGKQILTGYDADEAGEAASARWAEHYPGASRLNLTSPRPGRACKDITEYLLQGGCPADLVASALQSAAQRREGAESHA